MKYIINFLFLILIIVWLNFLFFFNWFIEYLEKWKVNSIYSIYRSTYIKLGKKIKWKKYFSKSNNYLIVKYVYFLKWQKISWKLVTNDWKEYTFKNKNIELFSKLKNKIKFVEITEINWKKVYWKIKLSPEELFSNSEIDILNNN